MPIPVSKSAYHSVGKYIFTIKSIFTSENKRIRVNTILMDIINI